MDQNSSQDLVSDFKSFHLHTHLGLGLCILFLICCFIVTIAIKWFLMVPFAIGSGYLLYSRKDHSTGLEKDVCTYGFRSFNYSNLTNHIPYLEKGVIYTEILNMFKQYNNRPKTSGLTGYIIPTNN